MTRKDNGVGIQFFQFHSSSSITKNLCSIMDKQTRSSMNDLVLAVGSRGLFVWTNQPVYNYRSQIAKILQKNICICSEVF